MMNARSDAASTAASASTVSYGKIPVGPKSPVLKFTSSGTAPPEIPYNQIQRFEKIGSGSSGSVYRGKYCHMNVAIKVATQKWSDMEEEEKDDFYREIANALDSSYHVNVIRFFGYCTFPEVCIVMEYCHISVLGLLNSKQKSLSYSHRLEIAIGLARGLIFLNGQNIVHRDIAARNLLIGLDGHTKIIDFGRSRRISSTAAKSKTKVSVGPVKWMAPEQIRFNLYSKESDVWAFGVTTWEIFTGLEPFANLAPLQAALQIVGGEYPDINLIESSRLRHILLACWRLEPDKRPTMEEILSSLYNLQDTKQ